MDLSKTFDTINHGLLLTKLKTHGFSKPALTYMCSYLTKANLAARKKDNWGFTRFSRWAAPF